MRKLVFTAFLFMCFALIVPNADAQQPYNHFALEHLKKSLEFLILGDYHNAVLSSNQLIRYDPNSAINYVIRARAYYEMKNYDMTIADCTHAIRIDRNNSAAFVIRGNAHGQKGDLNRAISDWEAALRINPNIDEAIHNIALARQNRGH